MKLLLVAGFFTLFLALEAAERCGSSDDCGGDECCIASGIFIFSKGKCVKLAQKGEKCSEEDEAHGFLDKQYQQHCPCASGLTCEPTVFKETWIGTLKFNPRCVGDLAHTTPAETEKPVTETETENPTVEPETEAPVVEE